MAVLKVTAWTLRRRWNAEARYCGEACCLINRFEVDFRSELGRVLVCECKDWSDPADFTTMAKFCRVLDSFKAKFGILFSKAGISGRDRFYRRCSGTTEGVPRPRHSCGCHRFRRPQSSSGWPELNLSF